MAVSSRSAHVSGTTEGRLRPWARRLAAVVLVALATVIAHGNGAEASPPPVCAGVAGCRVVAQADVDGDGRTDTVAVVRRGADGAAHGSVVVRVRTATRIATAQRRLAYWFGDPYRGRARLDGVPGVELVIGSTTGAHTVFEQVLTWRQGRLVGLRAPDGEATWVIDGAANYNAGWLRRSGERVGTLTQLTNERNQDQRTFTGTATRWRWSGGRWVEQSTAVNRSLPERTAFGWAGWHVPPLRRF